MVLTIIMIIKTRLKKQFSKIKTKGQLEGLN